MEGSRTTSILCQTGFLLGLDEEINMDKWDGYSASRDRILNRVQENGISNLVVLTGDQHNNWANEIKADFNDPN